MAEEHNASMSPSLRLADGAADVTLPALSLLGIQYKHGGSTPETGMDCSGLVRHVFKETRGTTLPRTSEEMSSWGQPVNNDDLQPGDLVFFNTLHRPFSHVGIYLGEKKFIHAPSRGGLVRVESMGISYWKTRFNGARRISDQADMPISGQ